MSTVCDTGDERSLRANLEAISLALAGRAGARLASRLGMPSSRSSLIRLLSALPDPVFKSIRVLGVDDFVLRRGRTYGTILVGMDTRRPIDLLDTRDAGPLRAWLEAQPGVEVICRDRAGAYTEAATTAAPQALQVADRYHLWANLVRAVEECLMQHHRLPRPPPPRETGAARRSSVDGPDHPRGHRCSGWTMTSWRYRSAGWTRL